LQRLTLRFIRQRANLQGYPTVLDNRGDVHRRLARIAVAVPVEVGLIGVRYGRARVAGISHEIAITVFLSRVRFLGAVVHIAAPAVMIGIVVWIEGAEIASVRAAITISVLLPWVGNSWAVIARAKINARMQIAKSVAVRVRTGVTRVTKAILV
jgi:hypothetical protein